MPVGGFCYAKPLTVSGLLSRWWRQVCRRARCYDRFNPVAVARDLVVALNSRAVWRDIIAIPRAYSRQMLAIDILLPTLIIRIAPIVTTYGVPSVIEANKRGLIRVIRHVICGPPVGLIVRDRRLSEGPFSPLGYCLLRCHRNHAQGESKKISKYKFFHRSTLLTATSQVAASNSTP